MERACLQCSCARLLCGTAEQLNEALAKVTLGNRELSLSIRVLSEPFPGLHLVGQDAESLSD